MFLFGLNRIDEQNQGTSFGDQTLQVCTGTQASISPGTRGMAPMQNEPCPDQKAAMWTRDGGALSPVGRSSFAN